MLRFYETLSVWVILFSNQSYPTDRLADWVVTIVKLARKIFKAEAIVTEEKAQQKRSWATLLHRCG